MKNLTNKQQATNSVVKGLSTVLGGIHMVSSIIADSSLNAEINLHRKYYTNEDGTKPNSEQLLGVLRNRLGKTAQAKEKIGLTPMTEEHLLSIFNESAE